MSNPANKLFRYLLEEATPEDLADIKEFTRQNPSDIPSRGCEMSEVVNKCLDSNDELEFPDAFKNNLP
jgi:hypothetical protein